MNLPSVAECDQLFARYHVPKNIHKHCWAVSRLAVRIAEQLKARGIVINVELVRIGSLLHDWMKAAALEKLGSSKQFPYEPTAEEIASWEELRARFAGKHESEIAAELLKDDYPELAAFIRGEGALSHELPTERGWEEKVVHYADWRVLGEKIIPLKERLQDFFERYYEKIVGDGGLERWKLVVAAEEQAEREICGVLQAKAEEL